MAQFVLIFKDTIDGGIDAAFDKIGEEVGKVSPAIEQGERLMDLVRSLWTYKEEVTRDERKESKADTTGSPPEGEADRPTDASRGGVH